jgi:formylglycine-generating enzyme required for sulfatase activity
MVHRPIARRGVAGVCAIHHLIRPCGGGSRDGRLEVIKAQRQRRDLPVVYRNLLIFLFLVTACAAVDRAMAQDYAPLSAEKERSLKPKDTFQECDKCPKMLVVPPGSFTMGSAASEPGSRQSESPQHLVTISKPFAVGQFPVTFDEWDACVADGGCNGFRPMDYHWGRGPRPVVGVDWNDAHAYVAWLAQKTGKAYRLLSESEYEYATRAGTTTAFPWGSDIGQNNASCKACGSQWDNKQTAPVGSFPPNAFGLYDMVGNSLEWTEDCLTPPAGWPASLINTYEGAPVDGSAWTSSNCNHHIIRGGAFDSNPDDLRSAHRTIGFSDEHRLHNFGFRVARILQ